MLTTITELDTLTECLIKELNVFCKSVSILDMVQVDHFGIKCSSTEIYERQKSLFSFESVFIYESVISKRRISIIGLKKGIQTDVGTINYLELSDQKPDGSQKDLVDHVEIIPKGCSYDELINHMLSQSVPLKENIKIHHTTYDVILPSGYVLKFSREKLLDKIKREELV